MQLSPALAATGTYPFVQLEQAKRRLADAGVELIDFGKGDPREPTDPMIRRALAESLTEISTYPLAEGLPELRGAVAGWCERRFGVPLDPDTEIVPTYGSKEAIFLLAQVVVDRDGEKPLVVTTQPGYPVPDRGATALGTTASLARHLLLPTICLALSGWALVARYARAAFRSALGREFLAVARAKGLSRLRASGHVNASFDDFSVVGPAATSVPEPATLALLGLGLFGLGWNRRKKA